MSEEIESHEFYALWNNEWNKQLHYVQGIKFHRKYTNNLNFSQFYKITTSHGIDTC